MNLLHLAPEVQEQLLFLEEGPASPQITERELRTIAACVYWKEQRKHWKWVASPGLAQTQPFKSSLKPTSPAHPLSS